MKSGSSKIGSHKHTTSGHSPKSPRFCHQAKREAERNSIKNKSKIKDPKQSVSELFRKGN